MGQFQNRDSGSGAPRGRRASLAHVADIEGCGRGPVRQN